MPHCRPCDPASPLPTLVFITGNDVYKSAEARALYGKFGVPHTLLAELLQILGRRWEALIKLLRVACASWKCKGCHRNFASRLE